MKNKTIKKTVTPTIEEQQQLLNLYNQGLFAEAVKNADAFIAIFPTHEFGWKVLGSSLQNSGRNAEALVVKRKVVELSPNDAAAHNNLAVAFKVLELFDEAEKSCRRALELNPKFDAAYCNLGNVFQEQENFSEAEKCYKHALKMDSTSAEFHNNLGAVLKKQDKNKEAETSYRKALAINPNFPDALGNLAQLLFSEKRYLEADSVYQHSLRYVKNQPDFNEFIYTRLNLCCWNEMKENLEKLAVYFEASNFYTCNPFAILSFVNFNAFNSKKASYLFANKKYKRALSQSPITNHQSPITNHQSPITRSSESVICQQIFTHTQRFI